MVVRLDPRADQSDDDHREEDRRQFPACLGHRFRLSVWPSVEPSRGHRPGLTVKMGRLRRQPSDLAVSINSSYCGTGRPFVHDRHDNGRCMPVYRPSDTFHVKRRRRAASGHATVDSVNPLVTRPAD